MIPKKFTLGAVDWTVEIDNEGMSNYGALGVCEHVSNHITIVDNYKGDKLTQQNLELSLYHEVVHAILGTLGEMELNKNEEFVNKLSLLLHQFEKTKK